MNEAIEHTVKVNENIDISVRIPKRLIATQLKELLINVQMMVELSEIDSEIKPIVEEVKPSNKPKRKKIHRTMDEIKQIGKEYRRGIDQQQIMKAYKINSLANLQFLVGKTKGKRRRARF